MTSSNIAGRLNRSHKNMMSEKSRMESIEDMEEEIIIFVYKFFKIKELKIVCALPLEVNQFASSKLIYLQWKN